MYVRRGAEQFEKTGEQHSKIRYYSNQRDAVKKTPVFTMP